MPRSLTSLLVFLVLISSGVVQMQAGAGEVWGVNAGDQIWKRPADGSGSWTQVPGGLKHVSVGGSYVWGVNSANQIYKCALPCSGGWSQVDGALKQIDAGDSEVWGVSADDRIWKRPVDGSGGWTQVPGGLKHVAIGSSYVWGVNAADQIYKCALPCSGGWSRVDGALKQIDVGATEVWGVNAVDQIWKRPVDGSGGWTQVPGALKHVSVGGSYVWGVNAADQIYKCALPCSGGWAQADGGLKQISSSGSAATSASSNEPVPGKYTLRADTGRYLARCNGCVPGGAYPDSAGVHANTSDGPWSQWTLARLANGKWTLQADTGKYLSRCNGCGPGAYPDSAFVHAPTPDGPWSQWTLERRASGRWALKSDTGRYLARCNGCFRGAPYPDMAFVHETNPDASWAKWTLEPLAPAPQVVATAQPVTAAGLSTVASGSTPVATADLGTAQAELQQKISARNAELVKLNILAHRLSSGTQAAMPWSSIVAALEQYFQATGYGESRPASPNLRTLFGTLNDQNLVSSVNTEKSKAMQNQIADSANILNVCAALDAARQAQVNVLEAMRTVIALGGTDTVATSNTTQPAAPITPEVTSAQSSPQLFDYASQTGQFEANTVNTADCLFDSEQNKSGALFSVGKTCESKSVWVDIDCYHTKLDNTGTGNTVSVHFYANNSLVKTVTKKGVTSCGAVSTDPRWVLDTRSSVSKIIVEISGDDGFYIDELYIYQNGDLKKRFGKDDGKGWCLSTDPADARYWSGYIIDNVCSSKKEFGL